jgi:hypothetical protein
MWAGCMGRRRWGWPRPFFLMQAAGKDVLPKSHFSGLLSDLFDLLLAPLAL